MRILETEGGDLALAAMEGAPAAAATSDGAEGGGARRRRSSVEEADALARAVHLLHTGGPAPSPSGPPVPVTTSRGGDAGTRKRATGGSGGGERRTSFGTTGTATVHTFTRGVVDVASATSGSASSRRQQPAAATTTLAAASATSAQYLRYTPADGGGLLATGGSSAGLPAVSRGGTAGGSSGLPAMAVLPASPLRPALTSAGAPTHPPPLEPGGSPVAASRKSFLKRFEAARHAGSGGGELESAVAADVSAAPAGPQTGAVRMSVTIHTTPAASPTPATAPRPIATAVLPSSPLTPVGGVVGDSSVGSSSPGGALPPSLSAYMAKRAAVVQSAARPSITIMHAAPPPSTAATGRAGPTNTGSLPPMPTTAPAHAPAAPAAPAPALPKHGGGPLKLPPPPTGWPHAAADAAAGDGFVYYRPGPVAAPTPMGAPGPAASYIPSAALEAPSLAPPPPIKPLRAPTAVMPAGADPTPWLAPALPTFLQPAAPPASAPPTVTASAAGSAAAVPGGESAATPAAAADLGNFADVYRARLAAITAKVSTDFQTNLLSAMSAYMAPSAARPPPSGAAVAPAYDTMALPASGASAPAGGAAAYAAATGRSNEGVSHIGVPRATAAVYAAPIARAGPPGVVRPAPTRTMDPVFVPPAPAAAGGAGVGGLTPPLPPHVALRAAHSARAPAPAASPRSSTWLKTNCGSCVTPI